MNTKKNPVQTPIITITNSDDFQLVESYKALRTNLLFSLPAKEASHCRKILFTSAAPGDGKTTTTVNLALTLAEIETRVLLIDADMRKPTQRRLWKVELSTGLCDYLAKIWQLELAKVTELPLWIVCTGTIPPNPSELLSSDRMKSFVESCADYYDYVIIDTPPINTVADAQIISTFVDGVVLVARSGNTTADELNAATAAVRRAGGNLCGVVLNGLNMKSVKYASKYKYGDKYGYRYSYSESYGAK